MGLCKAERGPLNVERGPQNVDRPFCKAERAPRNVERGPPNVERQRCKVERGKCNVEWVYAKLKGGLLMLKDGLTMLNMSPDESCKVERGLGAPAKY